MEKINNIAELKQRVGIANSNISLLGYYSVGDGGGGEFYWDNTSTESDNGGTIIQVTGLTTGRWKRVLRNDVDVKWFGAKGDGITNDISSIQNAINTGFRVIFDSNVYLITGSLYIFNSNQSLIGKNTTIKQGSVATSIFIGYNGISFVKTDNISVENISFLGLDTTTSAVSAAISIYPPVTSFYSIGIGCSNIVIKNIKAENYTFGIAATGANNIKILDCSLGAMLYHLSLGAGGYGCLFQTCYNVDIIGNNFIGEHNDRHAIYISADPNKTLNELNVCRNINIINNFINWEGVTAITGFEACIVVRSASDINITANTINGGYGSIEYDTYNAVSSNVVISNNIIKNINTNLSSSRTGIGFTGSNDNTCTNVSINNNVLTILGEYGIGISLYNCVFSNIIGNNISSIDNPSAIGLLHQKSSETIISANTIKMIGGNSAIVFNSTNSNVLINNNSINGTSYFKYRFFTTPTNLRFGFARSFNISSNGTGTLSVNSDSDSIIDSIVSDSAGIKITFNSSVSIDNNISFQYYNSSIGSLYIRDIISNSMVLGITGHSGTWLPANTNSYTITGIVHF